MAARIIKRRVFVAAAGFKDAKGQGVMPTSLKGIDLVKLEADTIRIWHDVEQSFKPVKGKYAA